MKESLSPITLIVAIATMCVAGIVSIFVTDVYRRCGAAAAARHCPGSHPAQQARQIHGRR